MEPPTAEDADYDELLAYARRWSPRRLAELEAHLTPIRSAHRIDEHVQRHQGIHPGRPFAEDARDALALIESLPAPADTDAAAARTEALGHARLIVEFHENSVAGRGGFANPVAPAQPLIDHHHRTGARIVYWDGISHTSGSDPRLVGTATDRFNAEGGQLRAHFGAAYQSVAIGFHHGDLGVAVAPDPGPELIDAALGTVDLPAYFVDLRADAPAAATRWRTAPARARVISGVYDPARDEDAYIAVESLAAAFDVLIHIRETTPVRWLPEFDAT